MEKKTVLYLVTRMDGGGAQRSALESAVYFKDKYNVYFAAGSGGELEAEAKERLEGFRTVPSLKQRVSVFNLLSDFRAFLAVRRLIKEISPDILHTNTPKAGVLGRLAVNNKNIKVAHTYHGLGFCAGESKIMTCIYVWLERLCARKTDRFVFVSRGNLVLAESLGIVEREKSVIIPPGIAPAVSAGEGPAKKEELGINKDDKVVVSIGNFKRSKNAAGFARVAKKTLDGFPNVTFLYLGAGGECEAAAKKNAGGNAKIKFLGFRRDAAEILAASDLYISASLAEGLPMATAEALAAGVPAVCYRAGGTAEIVADGQNGVLVETGREDLFEKAVKEILSSENRLQALKSGARQTDMAGCYKDNTFAAQRELYGALINLQK